MLKTQRRSEKEKGLKELPSEFETEIDRAIAVDVSYNRFAAVPAVLMRATLLEELDLTGNALTTLPPELARLTALNSLKISLNPLGPQLPQCVFMLPALKELTARRCGIAEFVVPAEAVAPLRLLDLDDNELAAIPAGIGRISSLRVLNINGNRVETLPRSLGLVALTELRARRNRLRSLAPLPHALVVDLGFNVVLDSFPSGWFAGTTAADAATATPPPIRTLLLQGNAFAAVPDTLFRRLPSLETLDLSFNALQSLPAVTGPASLQGLFLGCNKLAHFAIAATSESLPNLQSLDISRNCLSTLPDLSAFISLRTLSAGFNPLDTTVAQLASFPTGLRELHLSGCKLAELPECVLPQLEYIFLADNKLRHRGSLKLLRDATTTMRFVDLSHNHLKLLPSRIANAKAVGVEVESDLFVTTPSSASTTTTSDPPSPMVAPRSGGHAGEDSAAAASATTTTVEPELVAAAVCATKFANPLRVGVSTMTGRRSNMEDVVHITGNLLGGCCGDETADGTPSVASADVDLLSVMDGHGSDLIAKTAAATIERLLRENLCGRLSDVTKCMEDVLKQAALESNKLSIEKIQGATALVGLFIRSSNDISKLVLHIANIGDTRAIVRYRDGKTSRLTVDHKPLLPEEYKRIVAAGGFVTIEGRVSDTLAIARALGDVQLRPYVSCEPTISSLDVTAETEFVVMASDGVWDVLTDDIAGNIVSQALAAQHGNPALAAKALRDCAFLAGSTDNISAVVVDLTHSLKQSRARHQHKHRHHTTASSSPSPIPIVK